MPFFKNFLTNEEISIPDIVHAADGRPLKFASSKNIGLTIGGWYQDENERLYMVKFIKPKIDPNPTLPYLEKLFNDLSVICVGPEFSAQDTQVGFGEIDGIMRPCFLSLKAEGYQDLTPDLRKTHPTSFHIFYSFAALMGNDDLHGANLGLYAGEIPINIDYGLTPPFLYPEQIAAAHTPFHLASLTGHRNLLQSQSDRRQLFGHESFIHPGDDKKYRAGRRVEDLSCLSVLEGVARIIENKANIIKHVLQTAKLIQEDPHLTSDEKREHGRIYSLFAEILDKRISWMEENFRTELAQISDPTQRKILEFTKWRLHPKFAELMTAEDEVFRECGAKSLQQDVENFVAILSCGNKEEMLKITPNKQQLGELKSYAETKFPFYDALISRDFKMMDWLIKNDIFDPNQNRARRNYCYYLHRTTPLHAAIAIYHDSLFYEKAEDLDPLRKVINDLTEQFHQKNGIKFDETRDYRKEGNDYPQGVKSTFEALEKYQTLASKEALAATKIQREFRALQSKTLTTSPLHSQKQ